MIAEHIVATATVIVGMCTYAGAAMLITWLPRGSRSGRDPAYVVIMAAVGMAACVSAMLLWVINTVVR